MGPEITAILAAAVSIGTLVVGYLGLRTKASSGFVDSISARLAVVEVALIKCEERERELAEKLIEAYKLAAEEVRRGALIDIEANMLRRELVELRKCPIAVSGKCPPDV